MTSRVSPGFRAGGPLRETFLNQARLVGRGSTKGKAWGNHSEPRMIARLHIIVRTAIPVPASLENVRVGDEMRLLTPRGAFEYRVHRLVVVGANDTWVLNPSEHVSLTLITCYPFRYLGSARERFVVQAERVSGG